MFRTKEKLFEDVKVATSREAQLAKGYEEVYLELRKETENIKNDIINNGGISEVNYLQMVNEIADSIITIEQITKNYDMLGDIRSKVGKKLDRLEVKLMNGTLMDGLDMSVMANFK